MRKYRRRGWMTLGLLATTILFVGVMSACREKVQEEAVKRPSVDQVTVVSITPVMVDEIYETTGTIRSDRTSLVASRAMGVVTSLLVQEGDIVKAGQLLLTLDDRDAAQRAQAADMALEAARQNKILTETSWQRYKTLYDEKALSRQEMDQISTQKNVAKAEFERATAMADEARTYRSFARVISPVSGTVTQKRIEAGSMASPGMPLIVIEERGSFHVEAAVDERLRDKIKTGMAAEVFQDSAGSGKRGTIRQVMPAIDAHSRTFIIKIGIKDAPSRSGLFVRVRIPVGKKEVVMVPDKAIVRKGQLTGVYAVDDHSVVTYRLIRTGAAYAEGQEIISGLASGERVITDGIERAKDGGLIKGGAAQ